MDFRSNRLRNLLLNDDRSRGEVAEILDVCLRHLVPHNHNHYNIYLSNNNQTRTGQSEDTPLQSQDITSSINNLVDSIVTEIAHSPVEVNTVPVSVSSREQSTTTRQRPQSSHNINTNSLASGTPNNYEILITDNHTNSSDSNDPLEADPGQENINLDTSGVGSSE